MKKLFIFPIIILIILAFAIPALAADPPYGSPPVTYPLPISGHLEFPELGGMTIDFADTSGTYTPHIVHPANSRPYAEESWIEFNGSGYGVISFPALGDLPFTVPYGTTARVTVHIQKDQVILTLKSSAPVELLSGTPFAFEFTNAQVRLIPDPPFYRIIHVK
jgi:hypothetical protein